MTRKKQTDSQLIEAYKQQAKSRRASSKLKSTTQDIPSQAGLTLRQNAATYGRSFTTEGITQTVDGRVTVIMKGLRPLAQSQLTEVFGRSSVSIPEYRSVKESTLEQVTQRKTPFSNKKK